MNPDIPASSASPAQPLSDVHPTLTYASPVPLAQLGDIFRDSATLIARDTTTLPQRCILCGTPPSPAASHKPVTLQFTWDESFTVTQRSTLQLRQKASIRAFLCSPHRTKWVSGRILGIVGIMLSLALTATGPVISIISESSDIPRYTPLGIALMLTSFAALILSLFFFTLRTRTLTCSRIEAGYLYLDGAAPSFLDALPQLPHKTPPISQS